MRKRFIVEAELSTPPGTSEKEVEAIVKRYIRDLKLAGGLHIGTESIKDEAGQEVMIPWPTEENA